MLSRVCRIVLIVLALTLNWGAGALAAGKRSAVGGDAHRVFVFGKGSAKRSEIFLNFPGSVDVQWSQ